MKIPPRSFYDFSNFFLSTKLLYSNKKEINDTSLQPVRTVRQYLLFYKNA